MYVIVLFDETDEVGVVPKSWIKGDQCWWPNKLTKSHIKQAIEQQLPPEPDWMIYRPVIVLKETENYDKARSKCIKAIERLSSDLSTTDGDKKRKFHHLKCYDPDEGEDELYVKIKRERSDSDDYEPDETPQYNPMASKKEGSYLRRLLSLPPLELFPRSPPSSENLRIDTVNESPVIPSTSNGSLSENLRIDAVNESPVIPSTSDGSLRDGKIFTLLDQIKGMVQNSSICIRKIAGHRRFNLIEDSVQEFHLPLKSEKDVHQIETLLQNKEKLQKLIYHLSILGGFTNREVLERILSCLFSSTLAPRYNWKGKGQKRGLESLMLAKAVKAAAKYNKISDSESEFHIKGWLKNANDRECARKKRAEQKRGYTISPKHEMMRIMPTRKRKRPARFLESVDDPLQFDVQATGLQTSRKSHPRSNLRVPQEGPTIHNELPGFNSLETVNDASPKKRTHTVTAPEAGSKMPPLAGISPSDTASLVSTITSQVVAQLRADSLATSNTSVPVTGLSPTMEESSDSEKEEVDTNTMIAGAINRFISVVGRDQRAAHQPRLLMSRMLSSGSSSEDDICRKVSSVGRPINENYQDN